MRPRLLVALCSLLLLPDLASAQFVGTGLKTTVSATCSNSAQSGALRYVAANYAISAATQARAAQSPQTRDRVIDITLDRQSFLNRGWTNDMLGKWNQGARSERKGLFLSMFYALQMGNEKAALGKPHLWDESIEDYDRGMGAHIDYFFKEQRGLHFLMYVYDNESAPTKRAIIVGRNHTEAPFNTGPCSGPNVIGCAGDSDKIYLRTDYSWALGERLDAAAWIKKDALYYLNITYVIAHEVGHFFGFDHVNGPDAIMYASIGGQTRQRWHDASNLYQQVQFRALAAQLK
jgi:Matrixin